MDTAKVAISINKSTLNRLDRLVKNQVFPSRSRAIQVAVEEQLKRMEHSCLARECAKLDAIAEKSMEEEGLSEDLTQWPRY